MDVPASSRKELLRRSTFSLSCALNNSKGAKKRGMRGQISVMIAVMMSTFILLFVFVINTGMLVHARINIQNAADLAAYAGAAVQARQMNQISFLNYEMRRQFKKFLFKVYAVGPSSLLPNSTSGSGPMKYLIKDPNGAQINLNVPVTCIIFQANDNYCQVVELSSIQIPPASYLDSITDTLRDQLTQIEAIRRAQCGMIGLTNKLLNYYWLFNADPQLASLRNMIKAAASSAPSSTMGPDQIKALQTVQGLAEGVGIVPRELLLSYRIETLQKYLNAPSPGAMTINAVQNLFNAVDPAPNERPVSAFLSAYYSLGNHLFDGSKMTVEEFLPQPVITLRKVTQAFDVYALDKVLDVNNNCRATLVPYSVGSNRSGGIPVAYYKDPTTMVSYAVRVKATAQILFSPFGPIEMKAYAAAQPFGSRIGPVLADNPFGSDGSPNSNFIPVTSVGKSLAGFIPNLSMSTQDGIKSVGRGAGWDTVQSVNTAFGFISPPGQIDAYSISNAYPHVLNASPVELGQYNILNDLASSDPFMQNYDASDFATLYAPIFPPGQPTQTITDSIHQTISELYQSSNSTNASVGAGSASNSASNAIASALMSAVDNYVNSDLRSGTGEDSEGWNTVRLSNPFRTSPPGGALTGSSMFTGMAAASDVSTSWSPSVDTNEWSGIGRTGYSVKMVSLGSLRSSGKNTTNGSDLWTNDLNFDDEASADIAYIQH